MNKIKQLEQTKKSEEVETVKAREVLEEIINEDFITIKALKDQNQDLLKRLNELEEKQRNPKKPER